ncbi:zinc-dependent alcohol dehydrogenase family protein [Flavihumibacter rivuli]|uniref:zinc-dependent alcohol dehydrogenase family protein n=1 Tax=Flavihumibacter rivuli TaxID=2838156 RepID=UPI001BDE2240|nr:zinc-dependent alcohol dehydrogenase family protein [Flavihumibacter rivuli]ULQ55181.1 zinc-dependent alcohol dehydrogenase family protein [Flavihumibacter rivuli]
MKAIYFERTGKAEAVLGYTQAWPEPVCGDDGVVVKVMARVVNPADHLFINGNYRVKPALPAVAGLEGAGLILEKGKGVTGVEVGDRVAFRHPGTWAEKITVPSAKLIKVKAALSWVDAAQLALNPLTAYALVTEANIGKEGYLLMNAADSALGKLVIQLARMRNIRVIALVRSNTQGDALKALGANVVLVAGEEGLNDRIMDCTNGKGVNAYLDAVGGSIVNELIPVMAVHSKLIVYGLLAGDSLCLTSRDIIFKNLSIAGFGIDKWMLDQGTEKLDAVYEWLQDRIIEGELVIPESRVISLEDYVPQLREGNLLHGYKSVLM